MKIFAVEDSYNAHILESFFSNACTKKRKEHKFSKIPGFPPSAKQRSI